MDIMKVKSNLLRKAIGKALNRYLRRKLGYDINITLENLEFTHGEDITNLKLSIEAKMTDDQLKILIADIGLS